MRKMAAAEFKAKCLAVLDDVNKTGEPVLVTKRGKVVARVLPAAGGEAIPQDSLAGSVAIVGDIVSPVVPRRAWSALARPRGKKK